MKNFEIISSSVKNMAELLEFVQGDALDAEGCSIRLKLPGGEYYTWEEWLEAEAEEEDASVTPMGSIYKKG